MGNGGMAPEPALKDPGLAVLPAIVTAVFDENPGRGVELHERRCSKCGGEEPCR